MKNEKVVQVYFHIARNLDGRTLSSISLDPKGMGSNKMDAEITLIAPGVLIETKKSRRIIPYSNIQEILLAMEEEK